MMLFLLNVTSICLSKEHHVLRNLKHFLYYNFLKTSCEFILKIIRDCLSFHPVDVILDFENVTKTTLALIKQENSFKR